MMYFFLYKYSIIQHSITVISMFSIISQTNRRLPSRKTIWDRKSAPLLFPIIFFLHFGWGLSSLSNRWVVGAPTSETSKKSLPFSSFFFSPISLPFLDRTNGKSIHRHLSITRRGGWKKTPNEKRLFPKGKHCDRGF